MNTESRTKIDYIAELLRIIQQTPSFSAFSLPFPSIWCSVHTGPQPRSAISSWFDLLPPSPPHPSHRPFPLPFQLVLLRSSLTWPLLPSAYNRRFAFLDLLAEGIPVFE